LAPDAAQSVLPLFEPKLITGLLTVAGGGAAIDLPNDCVYLAWSELALFLAAGVAEGSQEPPMGLILSAEQFDGLAEDRALVHSLQEWEQRSVRFMFNGGAIQVHWEEGWVDTTDGLPSAEQLMVDYQVNAKLMSRRQAFGPGVSITVDSWGLRPTFDSNKGVLAWSLNAGFTFSGPAQGLPGLAEEARNVRHLGAKGYLSLILEGPPNDQALTDRLQAVSNRVVWDKGCAYTTSQPEAVGELTGGLRRIMLPRLIFGDPASDRPVHRNRSLGFTWILVLLPVGIAIFIFARRIMSASRPPPAAEGTMRCPSCGSPASTAAARCTACGKSLVR